MMLASQRRTQILADLDEHGTVRVSDLCAKLGVSDMTIRRDLTAMQRAGLLEKVHGGARTLTNPLARERPTAEPEFAAKAARNLMEKEAIAARAVELVAPGMAIAVSAGTTTHALARYLADVPGLTVVTNSVWVSDVLHERARHSINTLLTGGMRTPSDALVGPLAAAAVESLHLDLAFLGVHGLHPEAGCSTPNLLEAEINRAMVHAARQLVVVADSSKWGVVGLSSMASLDDIDVLVTDDGFPERDREVVEERVGDVIVCDTAAVG
ncbi:MAG: DeoR/GlpR family DNA-binding transcription regulator [Nocardioides sp.]|jgi:DeoR/GlpR family transcriptional regulator of sugar metabolism